MLKHEEYTNKSGHKRLVACTPFLLNSVIANRIQ